MGALTLKNFPFKLRGWDIEKFESIDPTDGFGVQTRVFISNNQIVQIEPGYNSVTHINWITDKSRQFFDSIFGAWSTHHNTDLVKIETENWENFIYKFLKISFIQNQCYKQTNQKCSFNIIFNNVSLEILSLLTLMSKNNSFINIKKADNFNISNDLEATYQINNITKQRITNSSLCLFLATNTRHEGAILNLILRQRFLKGNFKFISIGSLLNYTFFNVFLGSNIKILKTLLEGNHLICQNLKFSKNPLFILNNELTKRADLNLKTLVTNLNNMQFLKNNWIGLNILSTSIYDTGNESIKKFPPVNAEDSNFFSFLYFLNTPKITNKNLEKITKLKLLNYLVNKKSLKIKNLIIYQSPLINEEKFISQKKLNNFHDLIYVFTNTFYENEEILITTEGLINKTNKLISRKKTKSEWQILRKMLNQLNEVFFLIKKENRIILFNVNKIHKFRNFVFLQYQATKSLINTSFYLTLNSKSFIFKTKTFKFNAHPQKLILTKLKYWLDDFFCGSKDAYSSNSTILINCSKIARIENTNFF